MKRWMNMAAGLFALSLVGSCLLATAQVSPLVGPVFGTISATGPQATVGLAGQQTCAVSLAVASGSPTFSITPQASNDNGATWVTVASMGTITGVGNASGSIAPYGLSNFRLNVTALSGGTLSFAETCSVAGSLSAGNITVSIPTPLPVTVSGPIVISSLPPIVTAQATCPGTPNAPCAQITGPVTAVISGVPTVQVSGVPTVQVSGVPQVAVSGQPAVSVSALPGPAVTSIPGGVILVQNVQANASPIPNVTSSPGGVFGQVPLTVGANGVYPESAPDSIPTPAAVTATNELQLFCSTTSSQNCYIYHMGVMCTATCAGLQLNISIGTGPACGGFTFPYFPIAITGPTTKGNISILWGAQMSQDSSLTFGGTAGVPLIAPVGYNVCTKFTANTSWTGTAVAFGLVSVH